MKNILVIDPSIMIHKIVQLAFPESDHNLFLSSIYPPELQPEEPVSLILLSADLPDHEDVFALGGELKETYKCPILMMIPKFFEYDDSLIEQNGLDAIIEKPFTSDTLKEKYRTIVTDTPAIDELESLSPEELQSITEEEFMLSEEDLLDIGEEDLADIEIPDTPPESEEPETADISDIPEPEPASIEKEKETTNAAAEAPFEDMEMDEDLDSIDFGDLEDGESLLDEPAVMPSDSLSEEETVSTTENELSGPSEGEEPAFSEISETTFAEEEEEATPTDVSEDILVGAEDIEGEAEKPLPASDEEEDLESLSSESPEAEDLPEVGPQTIREAVDFEGETEIPSPVPEQVLEDVKAEPLDDLTAQEMDDQAPEETENELSTPQEEDEFTGEDLPDVNFAIEEEPQTLHVDEYEVERPVVEEEEEVVVPLDISHPDEDAELIPAPSSLSREGLEVGSNLSNADIQKIAERVVAMLSDKAIRDIAWEVIPVVAEEVVRGRIRELENEEVE
jgi:hypothetical protein